MNKLLVLVFVILGTFSTYGLNVQGYIPQDMILGGVGVDLNIVGDMYIPEGVTVTIRPGSNVNVTEDASIEVYGTLISEGTATDSIKYSAVSGYWGGIDFDSLSLATADSSKFSYCRISKAKTLFNVKKSSKLKIEHSYFTENIGVLVTNTTDSFIIDSCYFQNNYTPIAVTNGSVSVYATDFYSSNTALKCNTNAVLTLENCNITYADAKAIEVYDMGSVIIDSCAIKLNTQNAVYSKGAKLLQIANSNMTYNNRGSLVGSGVSAGAGVYADSNTLKVTISNTDLSHNSIMFEGSATIAGGGINCGADSLILNKVTVSHCILKNELPQLTSNQSFVGRGGAIYFNGESMILDSCTFYRNSNLLVRATYSNSCVNDIRGGAIYAENFNSIEINATEIYDNKLGTLFAQDDDEKLYGPGIYVENGKRLTIKHSQIYDHNGEYAGGGLFASHLDDSVVIEDCEFYNNYTWFGIVDEESRSFNTGGAGIFADSCNNLIVRSSTFKRNEAKKKNDTGHAFGGAIACSGTSLYLHNSLLDSNLCYGSVVKGGGIFVEGGYVSIDSSTITNSCNLDLSRSTGYAAALYVDNGTGLAITNSTIDRVHNGFGGENVKVGNIYFNGISSGADLFFKNTIFQDCFEGFYGDNINNAVIKDVTVKNSRNGIIIPSSDSVIIENINAYNISLIAMKIEGRSYSKFSKGVFDSVRKGAYFSSFDHLEVDSLHITNCTNGLSSSRSNKVLISDIYSEECDMTLYLGSTPDAEVERVTSLNGDVGMNVYLSSGVKVFESRFMDNNIGVTSDKSTVSFYNSLFANELDFSFGGVVNLHNCTVVPITDTDADTVIFMKSASSASAFANLNTYNTIIRGEIIEEDINAKSSLFNTNITPIYFPDISNKITFVEPQFYNSYRRNFNLREASPLVDAGRDDSVAISKGFDLNHGARLNNGVLDLGAFEIGTRINTLPVTYNSYDTLMQATSADFILKGEDWDGVVTQFNIIQNALHGTVSLSDSVVSYTPEPSFFGKDSIVFFVTDDSSTVSNQSTLYITVKKIPPVTYSFSESTIDAKIIYIPLKAVASSGTIDYFSIVTEPVYGSATIVGNTLRYHNNGKVGGLDSLEFKVVDSDGVESKPVFGYIDVTVPPHVVNNSFVVYYTDTTLLPLNTYDNNGDIVEVVVVDSANHGWLELSDTLSLSRLKYIPDGDFIGVDSFTYCAIDNDGLISDTATVKITLECVPPPILIKQTVYVEKGSSKTFKAFDLNGNNSVIGIKTYRNFNLGFGWFQNDEYTYVNRLDGPIGSDTLIVSLRGNYPVYSEPDTLIVIVTKDGLGNGKSYPVSNDIVEVCLVNSTKTISLLSTDYDGSIDHYEIVTNPVNGVATLNGGSVVYKPDGGFVGVDSIIYVAYDDQGNISNRATLLVFVDVSTSVEFEDGLVEFNTIEILVYPNPYTSTFRVSTELEGDIYLYKGNVNLMKVERDIPNTSSDLPPGVYFIVVQHGNDILGIRPIYKTK